MTSCTSSYSQVFAIWHLCEMMSAVHYLGNRCIEKKKKRNNQVVLFNIHLDK